MEIRRHGVHRRRLASQPACAFHYFPPPTAAGGSVKAGITVFLDHAEPLSKALVK